MLILQTDVDGLLKLKESACKKRAEKAYSKDSNTSEKSESTLNDDCNSEIISNFSFDACEISELQITSV